jgi:hypothetical protein
MGIFTSESDFNNAVRLLRSSNTAIEELYSPVPVHEAVRAVAGRSRIPTLMYVLGFFSMLVTLAFLYYTAVIDWPLNIGGKPSNAFPSFIIVTLVITIFLTTILSLLVFSIRSGLYPGKKAEVVHNGAMDDKFIVVLNSDIVPEAEDKLKQSGAEEVIPYYSKHD